MGTFSDGVALLADLLDGGRELPVEGEAHVDCDEDDQQSGGQAQGNPSHRVPHRAEECSAQECSAPSLSLSLALSVARLSER